MLTKIVIFIADHLPRSIAYQAGMRIWGETTSGIYGHTEVPAITMGEALTRFAKGRRPEGPPHRITACCSYHFKDDDCPIYWNPFNNFVQCHNCGHVYTPKPSGRAMPQETHPRWHSRDEKRGPEAPCVLAAFDRDGKATFGIAFESTDSIAFKRFVVTDSLWTHWTPLPPRPKP